MREISASRVASPRRRVTSFNVARKQATLTHTRASPKPATTAHHRTNAAWTHLSARPRSPPPHQPWYVRQPKSKCQPPARAHVLGNPIESRMNECMNDPRIHHQPSIPPTTQNTPHCTAEADPAGKFLHESRRSTGATAILEDEEDEQEEKKEEENMPPALREQREQSYFDDQGGRVMRGNSFSTSLDVSLLGGVWCVYVFTCVHATGWAGRAAPAPTCCASHPPSASNPHSTPPNQPKRNADGRPPAAPPAAAHAWAVLDDRPRHGAPVFGRVRAAPPLRRRALRHAADAQVRAGQAPLGVSAL
jgi:hypothetical protein